MDTPQKPPIGRVWKNGKRLTLLPVGGNIRVVITEHFTRGEGGKLRAGAITARLEKGGGETT